jgi:hypothetical protein
MSSCEVSKSWRTSTNCSLVMISPPTIWQKCQNLYRDLFVVVTLKYPERPIGLGRLSIWITKLPEFRRGLQKTLRLIAPVCRQAIFRVVGKVHGPQGPLLQCSSPIIDPSTNATKFTDYPGMRGGHKTHRDRALFRFLPAVSSAS